MTLPQQQRNAPLASRNVGSALTLERRLQLIMATVLACILATSLVLTYGAITSSASSQLRSRLLRAAMLIARTVEDGAASRNRELRLLAGDSAIRALLTSASHRPTSDPVAALPASRADSLGLLRARQRAQERLRQAVDADGRHYPIELWSMDGQRLAWASRESLTSPLRSPSPHPVRRQELGEMQLADSMPNGDLYREGTQTYYWSVAPVQDRGRAMGFLATRVHVGGPPGVDSWLRDLTGEDVALNIRSGNHQLWLGREGTPILPPVRRESTTAGLITDIRIGNARELVGEAPVRGAPWVIVLESPQRALHIRAMGIVGKVALLSLVLAALGAVATHILGRRITRPLASLTTAAEAIAAGDFSRRVDAERNDEIGRLATAFNTMAANVDGVRRELENRVNDAQWTADELESTNRQLLDSMVEAEHARREAEGARAEAERANRAKSEFLAVMSHELRTPLNAIGGYAQLIELGIHGPVTEAQRNALERIGRSQAHLLRLINDVLYFARIDASRVQYEMRDVPLEETLRALEPLVAPQLSAKRLHFVYRPCPSDLTARADRDRLQQIVLNLLSNAIKFTNEGGEIALECHDDEDEVCIRVRDTGVGIPSDRLRAIFDPFVQVDRGRSRPNDGVGLGLAISRDLARGMGGELSAESTVGIGSSFTLQLVRGALQRPSSHADRHGTREESVRMLSE